MNISSTFLRDKLYAIVGNRFGENVALRVDSGVGVSRLNLMMLLLLLLLLLLTLAVSRVR